MKIRLLNNGSYSGLGEVPFPVEVEATPCVSFHLNRHVTVVTEELVRVGGDPSKFGPGEPWLFVSGEYEVVI